LVKAAFTNDQLRSLGAEDRETSMSRLLSAGFLMLLIAAAGLPAAADESGPPAEATAGVVASAPANVVAHQRAKAPADEYFGRLKMSILGVRNLIYDIDARADNASEEIAANLCHKLILAEDALRDWQAKYPDDTWIPKFGYAMLKDYETIDSDMLADESHAASIHGIDLANWLGALYPDSEFAPK
jgi:hypothetical protein